MCAFKINNKTLVQYLVTINVSELFYSINDLISMSLSFMYADFQLRKELLAK
jgi:hypothetical protein